MARSEWVGWLVLWCMPYVFALGSNDAFSKQMGQATFFWALCLVAVVMRAFDASSARAAQGGTAAGFAVALAASFTATAFVSGQSTSLSASGVSTQVAGGILYLPPRTAGAMDELRQIGEEYDISRSTPTMDLSGLSPGYQFQLGGRPLGRAYFLSTFPDSKTAAEQALTHVSCAERAEAWTLFVPENPYDLSAVFYPSGAAPDPSPTVLARVDTPQRPLVLLGGGALEVRAPSGAELHCQ